MNAPVLIPMIINTENARRDIESYVRRRVAKCYDRSLPVFNKAAKGINAISSRRSI